MCWRRIRLLPAVAQLEVQLVLVGGGIGRPMLAIRQPAEDWGGRSTRA